MTQTKLHLPNYQSVMDLANRLDLNREVVREILGVSESSQFRYEKNNPKLKTNLADRWSRVVKTVELAEELFEDDEEIKKWLSTPKAAFNGNCPLDMLSTEAGSRQVEQLLLQASYGVFA